jgi:8-oxo-dGTP pyrophosphatase MutT (NUDIX family)
MSEKVNMNSKLSWRTNKHLTTSKTILNSYPSIKTKISYGVIVVRLNSDINKLEAVLVKGRYTYEFNEFVCGNHSKRNIITIKYLLDQMTVNERCDILSLNFDQMWYRIWLNTNKNHDMYIKQKQKFEKYWMSDDGELLKELIKASKKLPNRDVRIEFSKGRFAVGDSSELECAIRETKEETNIDPSQYTIIPNLKKQVTFIQMNVKYIYNYYVGFTNKVFDVNIDFSNIFQLSEISDVNWMNFDQIQQVDTKHQLENIISPIFKQIRKYIKSGHIRTLHKHYTEESAGPVTSAFVSLVGAAD